MIFYLGPRLYRLYRMGAAGLLYCDWTVEFFFFFFALSSAWPCQAFSVLRLNCASDDGSATTREEALKRSA
jgi:hypothetical protein